MQPLAAALTSLTLAVTLLIPAPARGTYTHGGVQSAIITPYTLANRHSTTAAMITSANVSRLKLAWRVPTGEEVSHAPLVDAATGRVYVADWGGAVYAVDAATGHVVWRTKVEQPMTKAPWYGFAGTGAIGGGLLIEASVEGKAFGLDLNTGTVRWQARISDQPQGGSISKMLYYNGLAYIGLSSYEEPLTAKKGLAPRFTSFQGNVVALDAATGRQVWRRYLVHPPQDGVAMWGSFALDPRMGALFFGTGNNYTDSASPLSDSIVAVDARTGALLWSRQVTAHDVWVKAKPVGPDFDFGAGPQLFEATIDGQRRELVGAGQKSGLYFAFDRHTGAVVWATQVGYGATGGGIHAEAAIGPDNTIYVWSNNSYEYGKPPEQFLANVEALDPATGRRLWTDSKAQPAMIPAAGYLSNDVYVTGALDGIVRAYRASDGVPVWVSPSPVGSIGTALLVAGDTLFVGAGVPKKFGGGPATNGLFAYTINAQGRPNVQQPGL